MPAKNIYLDQVLIDALAKEAKKQERGFSNLVQVILREWMKKKGMK